MLPSQRATEEHTWSQAFLSEHPEGTQRDFDEWCAQQSALQADDDLRDRVRDRCVGEKRVMEILADGFSDDLGADWPSPLESIDRGPHSDQEEPRILRSGMRIGDFELIRFLARGGMGQVWVAEDKTLRREVALKLVLPERIQPDSLERFAREARAGGRAQHPNLVHTFSFGTDSGLSWIAQELVPGGWTLKNTLTELRTRSVTPSSHYSTAARLLASVAEGVHAAHDVGVIHRDLKPQNILVAPDGTPKVTDFGLARLQGDSFHSRSGDIVGTWSYMSPEQVAGDSAAIDRRSDVFSLGVVLYELLTLRLPFEGDTSHQIASRIIHWDPPSPSSLRSQCPQDLSTICLKALEKEPSARYASVAEFAGDLQRFLEHKPILAKPAGRLEKMVKWARRNPAQAVAVVTGVFAVTSITILAVVAQQNATEAEAMATENLRIANEKGELAEANRELAVESAEQAERAKESAQEARKAQLEAEQLNDDLMTLSASAVLDERVLEIDDLWPPHPDRLSAIENWLSEMRDLVGQVPRHRAILEDIRENALPWTEEEQARDRQAHPAFPELLGLEAELEVKRLALDVRNGSREVVLPVPDATNLPSEVTSWSSTLWGWVDPNREQFGNELSAIALAIQAQGLVESRNQCVYLNLEAWGRHAVGEDDRALELVAQAVESAPPDRKEQFGGSLMQLESATSTAWSLEALESAEREVQGLVRRVEALERDVSARATWSYPEHKIGLRWWDQQLSELILRLEQLEADLEYPERSSERYAWGFAKRAEFAARLQRGFAPGGEFDVEWSRYLPEINEAYPELNLQPQMGLVPIGPDPRTGYWEFAHLASGSPATRGEDDKIQLAESTGIVLVLLPAQTFTMGAQNESPDLPSFDPQAERDEWPPHEVSLPAYFLSKYETSAAQWTRMTAVDPSLFKSGLAPTRLHPVEQVTWIDADTVLRNFGLRLPTEAEWECGARGGTSTPWWTGSERETLRGMVNIADLSAVASGATWESLKDWLDLDDGGAVHMPIGHYPPNEFGLHEVAGNVMEWVQDLYNSKFYSSGNTNNPLYHKGLDPYRVARGGSFLHTASSVRSADRESALPDSTGYYFGVRAARSVMP